MMKKTYIVLLGLFVSYHFSFSQNYYFKGDVNPKREGFFSRDVMELNLQTRETKKIFDDVYPPNILSDMSKIILNTIPDRKICIYDTKSGKIDTLEFFGTFDLYAAYLVPYNYGKAIFIRGARDNAEWINKKEKVRVQTKVLIDKDTYSIIDSTAHFVNSRNSVISEDGQTYYLLKKDDNGIYFESYSTETGELINEKIAIEGIDISKIENKPYIEDCKNGLVFFGFITESEEMVHRILYKLKSRKIINYIIRPFGPPYGEILTQSGDMVYHDPEAGYIYILAKETAKLKQRIKVEPISEPWYKHEPTYSLFTLGDSLYFLPQRPENPKFNPPYNFDNIVHADVTKVQTNTSLIDMLTEDVEEAYQKGWIDNKGIYNSLRKKLQNAKKHLEKGKTKQAVNMLNAFLNEVEAQNGKNLTSEVYTLLKYNAELLIERLKGSKI